MPFFISGLLLSRYRCRPEGWYRSGVIIVLIWKKACINLFITYFNIELKKAKLTSHTDTNLMEMFKYIGWGMITVLIWKKAYTDLFITYFNIELKRTPTNASLLVSYIFQATNDSWAEVTSWGSREAWYRVIKSFSRYLPKGLISLLHFQYGQNWH